MRLTTVRTDGGMTAARVDDGHAVKLPYPDVGALLASGDDWRERAQADGETIALDGVSRAPLVVRPDKIICVGVNYRVHAEETGFPIPEHPVLFAKYTGALIGATDDIELTPLSEQVDWEAELGVVVGSRLRHVDEAAARAGIAGYTVVNDVSVRDWQFRSSQFLQGKTFEATTPVGPDLVTLDELDDPDDLAVGCAVDDLTVQDSRTSDMIIGPATIVSYVSSIITLLPGDLICMGTPAGVGLGMSPPRFLKDGEVVRTWVEGVGEQRNRCVTASLPA